MTPRNSSLFFLGLVFIACVSTAVSEAESSEFELDKRRGWGKRSSTDSDEYTNNENNIAEEPFDALAKRRGWGKRSHLEELAKRRGWGKRNGQSLESDESNEYMVDKRRGWGKRSDDFDMDKRRGWGKRSDMGYELNKRRGWGKRSETLDDAMAKRRGWGKRAMLDEEKRRGWGKRSNPSENYIPWFDNIEEDLDETCEAMKHEVLYHLSRAAEIERQRNQRCGANTAVSDSQIHTS